MRQRTQRKTRLTVLSDPEGMFNNRMFGRADFLFTLAGSIWPSGMVVSGVMTKDGSDERFEVQYWEDGAVLFNLDGGDSYRLASTGNPPKPIAFRAESGGSHKAAGKWGGKKGKK